MGKQNGSTNPESSSDLHDQDENGLDEGGGTNSNSKNPMIMADSTCA
jgi:hypothetical protein